MLLGRQQERHILNRISESKQAEMIAIIGRRRVGKTFLVNQHYKDSLVFSFTGTQYAEKENQLKKFAYKLKEESKNKTDFAVPEDWAQALNQLTIYMNGLRKTKRKKVIFFDEFPWIAGHRSGFLQEFTYWWNNWASKQHLTVIICGSAASWVKRNIVNNKGGLHNRITQLINLKPFTLAEVKQYFKQNNPSLDNYQILQLYMALGGIPHYLNHVNKGDSAAQTIDKLCFNKDGILRNEFNNLYAALYNNHERHVAIVRALSRKWKGLTRQEIIEATLLSDGGGLTKILEELEASSFITGVMPFGKKKKDVLYRLTDAYSLFYLRFIEGRRAGSRNIWLQKSNEQSYKVWQGYAFENVCIQHADAIKMAIGISGINSNISSYQASATDEFAGVQVDMLIDRADNTINLCEMKFYNDEYTFSKDEAAKLRRRRSLFQNHSKTKKAIFTTLVTTYGLVDNLYSGQVDQVVTLDDLFLMKSF